MTKLFLNVDGGARGNPGPAGAGTLVTDETGRVLARASRALGVATNNEAEYQAVLLGFATLKKLLGKNKLKETEVVLRLDSELVAKQLGGQYQITEPRLWPHFMKIWNARVANFPRLTIIHVPRAENSLADQLANEAMDGAVPESAGPTGLFGTKSPR